MDILLASLIIREQTNGDLDGFICAAGTGGTVTGVSTRLRLNRHLQLARDQKENHFISEEAANDRSSSSSSSSSGQTPITMEQILKHLNSNRKEKLALTDVQMQTAADPRGPPADGPLYGGPSGGPLSGGPTRGGPPGGPLTQGGPSEGLRERLKRVLADGGPVIGLADVSGAALFRYFTKGEMQTEGTSIVENIGQHRVTGNLEGFYPDFSCEIKDQEVLHWTHRLLQEEGLPLGMTSGVNVAGAVRLGKALGPQHTIVTMLCDYGHLYAQKQWNPQFLRSLSLPEPTWMQEKPPPEILEAVEASFLPVDGGEEVKKKMNH
ncbi:O-acetylserine (thiol) lyase, putative [Eimeria tenella]|uniref:O-acetylserine (Thiol) lyase, putative n=1 Tax=Eimeria tenella TaxID=5802 RepID=U6KJ49_EIMTE|nr:O-acetylserine (thiol) lyase, putative [Eimeria tenella]CDJ38055.1 O-acetylserine (thiol) lyase, putative [Eimeria tenella]|eukprot:XP_013228893.1 O-acetylserine (thiol) lyase, putative [Eimeria tenella]